MDAALLARYRWRDPTRGWGPRQKWGLGVRRNPLNNKDLRYWPNRPEAAGRNERAAGDGMGLPSSWNRSRATALGITLLLHGLAAFWLLALRPGLPIGLVEDLSFAWLPALPPPRRRPQSRRKRRPRRSRRSRPRRCPCRRSRRSASPTGAAARGTSRRAWRAGPRASGSARPRKGPDERPKEPYPPSIWAKPLPRVGATVTTPEGETIIWVSDYCFVSISSSSLTLKEIHDARRGVRTCIFAQFGGKKKPRDDLFDPIKRPPPPQEPGCGPDGLGQSCAR